ncbi:MAG: glycosyltransferase family 2 protein [Candidatus Ochrobactrum gambitense]|nr:MAG: glycosyltransferase family 2 protein [Candidatus Ochrobactrum gambitense]WEK16973.1 MAG: glycosyltransferase family 2 protein [Candidatus Ochrobactrum gambitense]
MKINTQVDSLKNKILTISIVTYNPDLYEFRTALAALADALSPFNPSSIGIMIVDNSEMDVVSPIIREVLSNWKTKFINGHGNIGFGRAHNLTLPSIGEFHLILNPDIVMDGLALRNALDFMRENPDCGLLSPRAYWPDGIRQYLCKRYPTILDLLLRGFAPKRVQELFEKRLSKYEMRAETENDVFWNPPIVSGCFMLFRGKILEQTGGFDPEYFLYFEDFDLSIRSGRITNVVYSPNVRVVHTGGNTARKGRWHIWQFFRSSLKFYKDHGFRLI